MFPSGYFANGYYQGNYFPHESGVAAVIGPIIFPAGMTYLPGQQAGDIYRPGANAGDISG